MSIGKDVVLDLILMMFPMLVFFIYNCYRELKCEKYNKLLFKFSLVSSIYLCFKFGNISSKFILLFCNLPIIISYLKNEWKLSLLLSFFVLVYSYFMFNINFYIILSEYFCYFLIYFIGKKKRISNNTFILLMAILEGFFISLKYFYVVRFNNAFDIIYIFLIVMLFYFLPFFLLNLFSLGDRISSLYVTVCELENEKKVKDSLFKITHEVKNPIAVCKGYLDMIGSIDNKDSDRYLSIIREEINRSLNIMNDFMEFSRIKCDKDIVDINLLLDDVCENVTLLINHNNVNFKYKLLSDEVFIMGDYNRLKQVFVNLIKNSFEAINDGGDINIVTHILNNMFYIEITDTGCGMDSDTLNKVKDMFYTTKKKGSGLGVSLSNEIIKAHDGSIDYVSRVGKGTKVIVKLPIYVL